MKSKLYILNSIEEFQDCKKDIRNGDKIIYTSELLGLQLKEIGCDFNYESFFKYLKVEDVNAIKYNCLDECYRISKELDSGLANDLKKEFGHSFSVYGPFVYYSSVIIATVQVLNKFIASKKQEFQEINIYDRKLANFFDSGSKLSDLLTLNYVKYKNFKVKSDRPSKKLFKNYFRYKIYFRLYDLIKWRIFIFKNNIINYNSEKHFFIRPLYDLKNFIKENNKDVKLIDFLRFCGKIKKSNVNLNFELDNFDSVSKIYSLYFINISKEINRRKKELFGRLSNLIKYLENKNINGFSWGNSPCQFTEKSSLISALQEIYPVVGFQHGGSYVDQVYPYHYHSDFFRCTSFYSYGFIKNDLLSYIDETQDIRIIPLGKKPVSMQSKLSKKNIVYVPTNSFNLYESGILRNLPNNLSNIQLEILNYIDTINNQNYKFTVKAFKGATINNSHFLLDSDKYNNLNFETQITLSDLLSKSIPGLIILDYPSTPLCEIIHLPIQIILHTDPVNPFTDDALKILNKRVHLCSSIDQVKSSIKCYLNNTLEHKNNDEYYRRYINPVH